jgi:hypothetical protein
MAYKGKVLDCLSDPARKFFKDEFKKDNAEASLRKLEYLILDIVRPYKFAMFFFMFCTLGLAAYVGLNVTKNIKASEEQQAFVAEKKRLKDSLEELEKKVITLSVGQPSSARESTAGMEDLAGKDLGQFFENLNYKADGGLISKDEIARLVKVGAAKDPVFTLKQVKGRQSYLSALSPADLAWLTNLAGSK